MGLITENCSTILLKIEQSKIAEDEKILNLLLDHSVSTMCFIDSLLSYYVSINFLGGYTLEDVIDLPWLDSEAIRCLTYEGETPFRKAKAVGAVWLTKRLSFSMLEKDVLMEPFVYCLLALKAIYLHQYLLGHERSTQLFTEFIQTLKQGVVELEKGYKPSQADMVCFQLLSSYLNAFYYQYHEAEKWLDYCCTTLKLNIKFSGALGKRTRFQRSEVANLTVEVNRSVDGSQHIVRDGLSRLLPKVVRLEDDTLLDTVSFTSEFANSLPTLSAEEQGLLLLFSDIHRLTHAQDEMTLEECLVYVNSVLQQAYETSRADSGPSTSSWPIATEALYRRSLMEQSSTRRTERSLSQLEELSTQFRRDQPVPANRSFDHFFLTRMPSIWAIELDQARLLMRMGCLKNALDVFLRWEHWTEIIECYSRLNKREKAEEIIRARLAAGDVTPELYCLLGDVTQDRQHYHRAWELSQQKSARAMRSLAIVHMYVDKDHEKAIECFQKSLDLNNLQDNTWFSYGCCCLQAKKFDLAEQAFRRCTQIHPENFEAWNNCASAVRLQGKHETALRLLQEAVKYNYENWRIWENILIVSIDVRSFKDAVTAYHRLMDLREKHADSEVLGALAKAVIDDVPDNKGQPGSHLRKELLQLFGRVTAAVPQNGDIWQQYGQLLLSARPDVGDPSFERAVQCLQKAHRCLVSPNQKGWEKVQGKRARVVQGLQTLAELVLSSLKPGENSADGRQHDGDTAEACGAPNADASSAFLSSTLASLRLNIKSTETKLKMAQEAHFLDDVQREELEHNVDAMAQLLASVEASLDTLDT